MNDKSPSEIDTERILIDLVVKTGKVPADEPWNDPIKVNMPFIDEAEKALNAHYLALALEIVGEDERTFSRMGDKSTIQQLAAVERNKLRAELIAAFRKALG